QPCSAGVADLVSLAALDEEQRSRRQSVAFPADGGDPLARGDVEPLIAPAVPIVGAALRVVLREHHLRRLRAPIAERDPEAFAEPRRLAFLLADRDLAALPGRFERTAPPGPAEDPRPRGGAPAFLLQ